LRNKQGILLLAFVFAVAAPAFADNIPGHSGGGTKYVTFSEGFTSQQNSSGNSAQCNFLFSSPRENGLSPSSFASTKGSELGSSMGRGMASGENSGKVLGFGGNEGGSSDKDKGKGKGKESGGSGDGNESGSGSGVPEPVPSVAEPGSETLLLFGLAGLGILFSRRKSFTNAI